MEDNKDDISMVKSGKLDFDKKRKRILATIKAVHDYLNYNDVSVMEYCMTKYMTADMNTKALWGSAFTCHKYSCYGRRMNSDGIWF